MNIDSILHIGTNNVEPRIKWTAKTLKKIPKGKTILDAGAGEQFFKQYCKHLNYTSQDFAEYDPTKKKFGLQMEKWDYGKLDIVSDICSIPVKSASYDYVLCTEVLEHVPDPVRAIEELHRVLKKGGRLIITAPFCSLTHFAPYHFQSGFNSFFYIHHFLRLKMKVLELKKNGDYFEYFSQELRRLEWIIENYSSASIIDKIFVKILKWPLLLLLQRFHTQDTGSSDMLFYGIHVIAEKK